VVARGIQRQPPAVAFARNGKLTIDQNAILSE
jgi:hypothetical protein